MNPSRVLFLGRTTLDVLYWLDRLPEEDTKVYARHLQAAPGGPALNAAITHSLLGGEALVISAIGGGPWAAQLCAELERHHLNLLDLAEGTAYEAPLCTVLVSAANSSRTIVNPPLSTVALRRLGPDWAGEVPADWGEVPPVVLSDGFFIEETSLLLAACQNAGAALVLDGGSWKPGTEQLAPLLTAAICSERFTVPGHPTGPESIFAWFAAQDVPYIAVTRGAKSILGWERGRHFEIEPAPIDAQDTLGAGDVLHGAFCHYFALEPDFEPALRRASALATLSCQSLGTQSWAMQPARVLTEQPS
jgi:sugar/nucleoside kinase (ribokinase family)